MKDIKEIAGLTFKVIVGYRIGKALADTLVEVLNKIGERGLKTLTKKLEAKRVELEKELNERKPQMEFNK